MKKRVFKRVTALFMSMFMLMNMVVAVSAEESTTTVVAEQTTGVDAQLYWTDNYGSGNWKNAGENTVFDGEIFEPGKEIVKYFKIANAGTRAFSYELDFVNNSETSELADVIDVYYKNDVSDSTTVADMGEKIGTLADVFGDKAVSDGYIIEDETEADGFYAKETVVAVALKMQENVPVSYMKKSIDFDIKLTANECGNQFAVKFENTDKYLYRVGNLNTVSLNSLFSATDSSLVGNVAIKVSPLNGIDANGTYTANSSDWTQGTIKFSGTGPVAVTISDDNHTEPVTLNLEVVDAKNVTTATSATANDVVLLNDISGTFTVSNGHTFFGNGFTVKLPTSSVQSVGSGFTGYISIGSSQDDGLANGGNLDNVRIEGPVYPEMYIYRDQAKITETSDSDYGDGNNMRYFKNSVIIYGGNCTISNSYISGSRTALCLRGGNNVLIENTTLSGGSYANMQICAGSSVTLRDLTTVQTDVTDSYGKGKTAHGLGIAVDSNVVDVYIEGELKQYNWLCEEQWKKIVPTSYQNMFPQFFTSSTFSKYWHYLNGGTVPYVNIAFIYACNWDTSKIHDKRTNVDYGTCNATIASVAGGVYSKVNTVGGDTVSDSDLTGPEYISTGFNPVAPVLDFDNTPNDDPDDQTNSADAYCTYDESSGTLKIGITGTSKTIDLSGVTIKKNGVSLDYTAYLNGSEISGDSVTVNASDGAKQILTFKASTNDCGYDKDGNPIEGEMEYTWTVNVEIATLAYPAPEWNMGGDYQFDTSNCVFAYYKTSQGYGEGVPIYEGIKVKYYNKNGELVDKDLSVTTTLPTGSNNSNSNAFTYTLDDGSTLTMKFSSGWKSGATTHQFTTYNNKVYIYPQSLDNDNYVRAKTTNQNFDVKITYTFTDPNGQSTETVTMNWYNAAASNGSVSTVQWKTFDSTNGKEDNNCLAEGTLITLADGSQKAIEDLTFDDELLVWDFFKGEYTTTTPSLLIDDGEKEYEVITLKFDDGSSVRVIYEHGFFDVASNNYVYINAENVDDFVGHSFVKNNGTANEKVKLTGYELTKEQVGCYTILTAQHNNCIANGLLTVTPPPVDGWYDYFSIGEDMKYDAVSMAADIEKYGLYTYEDFSDYISYEEFIAFNGEYLKILVGKGYFTFEDILEQIQVFGVGNGYIPDESAETTETVLLPETVGNTDVSGEAEIEAYSVTTASEKITEATTDTVILSGNSIKAATYTISVSGGIKNENGYICNAQNCEFTVTASGDGETGYIKITVDGKDYYTPQVVNDTYTVTVKNAKGKNITFTPMWGTYLGETIADNVIKIGFFIESLNTTTEKADVVFVNTTDTPVTGNAFVSVFNGKRFIDCTLQNITVNANSEYTYSSVIGIPNGYKVRAFMLGDGAKPLANVIEN